MAHLLRQLDADPTFLACCGGFFIGTYPMFVKTPSVLKAGVHPVAFQFYKSVWTALFGGVMVGLRWARGEEPAYAFTWWAVIAACVWVPAGCCLIAAVPRAGVGAGVLLFDGSTTLLSFALGLLAFHEPIKAHTTADGYVYYLAPVYLLSALLGMAALALLPEWVRSKTAKVASDGTGERSEPLLGVRPQPLPLAGYTLAIVAGALSAMQYGIVTVGKKEVPLQMGGSAALAYKEALDPLGSWTLTFGATACVVNACWLAGLSAHATATAAPLPALKLREVWAPASLAGVCYALSVIVTTLAVEKGGNALVPAQRNAVSLITSGAWGLVYYREVAGKAAVAWVGAAALTMASVVLLGLEKG